MKLRNRKTGEIKECVVLPIDENGYPNEYEVFEKGKSLTELNEEWEDYEEPEDKDFWFFDEEGIIRNTKEEYWPEESVAAAKAIGDYFETKEEAEKAVEKLKAWKRLKDKGFNFLWWLSAQDGNHIDFYVNTDEWDSECTKDLDLIFGGEE